MLCLSPSAQALDDLNFSVSTESEDLTARLRAASLLVSAQSRGGTDPRDLLATARAEYRALTGALYAAGYYSGTVRVSIDGQEAADLSPLAAPSRIGRIVVRVDPGPQFRFGRAEVAPLPQNATLPEGFRPDAPAESALIGDAARAGISGWREAGHAKATLAGQKITANHAAQKLDAQVAIDPGPLLRFGPANVTGNVRARTNRIKKIAGLPEGATFSTVALERSAARLRRTGAFKSVTLVEAETPQGTALPIEIAVVEEKTRRLGFGVELSSNEGVTTSGYWLHRNLFGGVERFRVGAEIAQIGGARTANGTGIDGSLTLRLDRPATISPETDAFITFGIERTDDPGYLSRSAEFSFGLTHRRTQYTTIELGIAYKASHITDASGSRDFRILSLPMTAVRDTRDATLDATTGTYLDLGITPFAGLSGTKSGARLTFDARGYRAFGERVTLAGRAQIGALWGPTLAGAPPDMLFFAGGGGSVRGLSYQQLGVTTGAVTTGGRSFAALSGEVRAKVTDSIGVVGFVDSGYVGAESFYDGSGDWATGAGIGLRYLTPIGPIRLDIATPVDAGPTNARGVQIYIGIGQAF